jgi:hypothetical protein
VKASKSFAFLELAVYSGTDVAVFFVRSVFTLFVPIADQTLVDAHLFLAAGKVVCSVPTVWEVAKTMVRQIWTLKKMCATHCNAK